VSTPFYTDNRFRELYKINDFHVQTDTNLLCKAVQHPVTAYSAALCKLISYLSI